MKGFLIKQKDILKEIFTNKKERGLFLLITLFIILNTVKISVFNYIISNNKSLTAIEYKIMYTFFVMTIFFALILLAKSRILFLSVYILQTLYIIINISYYLYFHSYLHILQFLVLFNEGFAAARQNSAPISVEMLVALIDLPGFILIYRNFNKIVYLRPDRRLLRIITLLIPIFFLGAFEIKNYNSDLSIIQLINNRYNGENPIVERYGTVVNNVVGIYLNRNEKAITSRFVYGKTQSGKEVNKEKPNFLFIQVESMDSNVISKRNKGEYLVPFLHNLSQNCVFYPYVLSEHMGGGTSDIEFSVINSIEPLEGYSAQKLSSYNYPNSFIKIMKKSTYSAYAFHGNKGDFFNRNVSFPKMGFNKFIDMDAMGLKDVGWGAPDKDVFNFAYDYLSKIKPPFISYIITMTSHGPFTNAGYYYNNTLFNDVKNTNIKNYLNSMSYVDKCLQEFVKKVRENFKNTYIIIYGDHTPDIKSDEYMQASFDFENKYFEFVPLFIITPDDKKYFENKKVASMLDLSPTALMASGVSFKVKSAGANLLDFNGEPTGIIFKNKIYDRNFLYNKVSSIFPH
ncbi:MAG: LTA synthase family protein [Bacillota bacterium]|nr:LTA synthase family protein [Bacillota bacterium]